MMPHSSSRRVLLVDADVDALGVLASALRARGITVFNSSDAFDAVEQAFQKRPEVVLAARTIEGAGDLSDAFQAVPEIADTPLLYLVDAATEDGLAPNEMPRQNLELLFSRLTQVAPPRSREPLPQEIRGNLEQMPLVDLLQLLAMNRRSGLLSVTTGAGAGEVRLAFGEVVDAAFRRLEGEKALYRLLGEKDGRFAFSPGESAAPRRIQSKTSALLMEAMRQVDELRLRRSELAPKGEALMFEETSTAEGRLPDSVGSGARPPDLPGKQAALARELVQLLQVPHSVDEILDSVGVPDLDALQALTALHSAGKLRRVPLSELTTPLASEEQLPILRSLVTRLARPGFAAPPRFVIAAGTKRMAALAHAVRRITDAVAPTEPPPRAPLPRLLGTLRLGDGVELSLTGLPGDDTLAPTWPLALPGAAAVVRLGEAGGATLEAHCQAVEVMLIEAESVMGSIDVAVPGQVAALVRGALEVAAGV